MPTPDRSLILQYLPALQELGRDMEDGIESAEALWESITMCKSSPDDIFEMEIAMHNHEVTIFAEQLTKNTLLNIIEQYQYYIENSCVLVDDVYKKSASVPIPTVSKSKAVMSPTTIRETPFDTNNGVTRKLLQVLQMNSHIDRVCKCSNMFNALRRVLMKDDEVEEAKVLEIDIVNITGIQPKVNNDLIMLEKMHGKFKRKMSEYEDTVGQINQVCIR